MNKWESRKILLDVSIEAPNLMNLKFVAKYLVSGNFYGREKFASSARFRQNNIPQKKVQTKSWAQINGEKN